MAIRDYLLPKKADLDSLLCAFLTGFDPKQDRARFVSGSASQTDLRDPKILCIECGSTGDEDRDARSNTFDGGHAGVAGNLRAAVSATRQFAKRLERLAEYVEDVDVGKLTRTAGVFPTLVQLVSGMLLVVSDPLERHAQGNAIFRAVLFSPEVDPYGSMEPILDDIPGAHAWVEAKRRHEEKLAEVAKDARWFTTTAGKRLAVIETTLIGAPGALFALGAEVVVALNPAMELANRSKIAKLTIAADKERAISVQPALPVLEEMELARSGKGGWGGPTVAPGQPRGIIGSPQDRSTALTLDEAASVVIETM